MFLLCIISSLACAKEKPNIAIIFADDQGYADVGCFGAEGLETPNLDKMASEGMKFTDFMCGSSCLWSSRAVSSVAKFNARTPGPKSLHVSIQMKY